MPKQVVRHAPFLRRYARALTGSQAKGDALVEAAVPRLLDASAAHTPETPVRVALYRTFHEVFAQSDAAQPPSNAEPWRSVGELTDRAAVLLVGVEDFGIDEAAEILSVSPDAVRASLGRAQARRAAASDEAGVLIIEDEPIIALDLTRLVMDLGHEVVGVATTHDSALALARSRRPGLVLADIRLADGSSGLEAATRIQDVVDVPVVYITAFPEHLLTGERPEPAFLVTKPFRELAVKALIGQALFFHPPARPRRIA